MRIPTTKSKLCSPPRRLLKHYFINFNCELLVCDVVEIYMLLPMFGRAVFTPFSGYFYPRHGGDPFLRNVDNHKTTWRHIQEGHNPQFHIRENLKCLIIMIYKSKYIIKISAKKNYVHLYTYCGEGLYRRI